MLHSYMNRTPATPVGLPRALFAASPKTEAAFCAPFWCSASPLDATLPGTLVCVASKGVRGIVSSLDATLTKNRGVGAIMVNQTSNGESLLPGPNILRGERRSRESFPLSRMDQSDSDSSRTRPSPSQALQLAVSLMPRTAHGTRAADHVSPTTDRSDTILGGFLRRSEMSTKVSMWIVLSLAGGALVCGPAVVAQQEPDWSKVQIKVTKVSGNIYMLEGQGGNIAASVGEDGIVIVDDEFAPLAEKIQAALKNLGITDKPVRFVINTHYHGDHAGGNAPFANSGSTVIAQDNVRKRLAAGGTAGNGGSLKMENKAAEKAALPIITFQHDVTVHLNGEDIRALHFPSGHTDGDAVIFFPKSNVVHMGDDFVTYGFPFIDLSGGGSVEGMISALEDIVPKLPPDVKVIPGHGPVSNLDEVRRYVTMLKDTRAAVDAGIKQGKTLDQLKQEKVLEPWKKWAGDFISSDAFIETLYNDLTGKKTGEFMKHN